jgi:hypothetical protein
LNEDIAEADFVHADDRFNLFALPLSIEAFEELADVHGVILLVETDSRCIYEKSKQNSNSHTYFHQKMTRLINYQSPKTCNDICLPKQHQLLADDRINFSIVENQVKSCLTYYKGKSCIHA